MPTLEEEIRARLATGETVSQLIAELQPRNLDPAVLDQALRSALASPDSSVQRPGGRLDATQTLTAAGILLIVAAAVIVIFSQWTQVGAWTRILFILVPAAALLAISASLASRKTYRDIQLATLGTGAALLPFAMGVALSQLQILTDMSLVVELSSLFGVVIFLILEFLADKRQLGTLSVVSLYLLAGSILWHLQASPVAAPWYLTAVSLGIAGFGVWSLLAQRGGARLPYFVIGTIGTALLLPMATLGTLNDHGQLSFERSAVILSLFGFPYVGIAILYQRLYVFSKAAAAYLLRLLLENAAAIVLLVPYLGLGSGSLKYAVVGLIVSFACLFGSIAVPIRLLLPLGAVGIVVGVLQTAFGTFAQSVGWPIAVFLSGFLILGLAFLVRRVSRWKQQSVSHPAWVLGLGTPPIDTESTRLHWGWAVLLILLLPALVSALIGLASYRNPAPVSAPAYQPVPPPAPD